MRCSHVGVSPILLAFVHLGPWCELALVQYLLQSAEKGPVIDRVGVHGCIGRPSIKLGAQGLRPILGFDLSVGDEQVDQRNDLSVPLLGEDRFAIAMAPCATGNLRPNERATAASNLNAVCGGLTEMISFSNAVMISDK